MIIVADCSDRVCKPAQIQEELFEEEPDAKTFLASQVICLAIGADMAMEGARQDVERALNATNTFSPKELQVVKLMLGDFEIGRLEATLHFLLEHEFGYLLRKRGAKAGGKLMVRTMRSRRAELNKVVHLAKTGLNKIRRNKLFELEPNNKSLLFRSKNKNDLVALMDALALEDQLKLQLVHLWDTGKDKLDFMVVINLELVARATTNLSRSLAEILGMYGIGHT